MGYQEVANGIGAMTCIVSVEKLEDGGYGEIRIVTGNKSYIDSIEHPAPGVEMLTQKFTPNSLYTDYMTRDLNFEQYCYQAAVLGKCLHSYAHPDRIPVWFNMTFLPVCPNNGNLYYCTYTMEINFQPDSARDFHQVRSVFPFPYDCAVPGRFDNGRSVPVLKYIVRRHGNPKHLRVPDLVEVGIPDPADQFNLVHLFHSPLFKAFNIRQAFPFRAGCRVQSKGMEQGIRRFPGGRPLSFSLF